MKPSVPFRPDKFPIFYGWIIVFAGSIGVIMSVPGQTIGVAVFTEDVRKALHISLSQWTFSYMIGTLISGFLVTQSGKIYDKVGVRKMVIYTSLMLAVFLLYLSYINHITDFANKFVSENYRNYSSMLFIIFGFFGLRFFAQGSLTLASRNMVMKWFDNYRGRISIILGLITILFFNSSPYFFKKLTQNIGWDHTWRLFAIIIGLGFSVFAYIFFRDNPQECNCVPDGNLGRNKATHKEEVLIIKNYTLKEVKLKYEFWVFNLIFVLYALYMTGLTLQIENIFLSNGYTQNIAYSIFIPSAIIAIAFSIVTGFISDKIKLRHLFTVYAFSLAFSIFGLLYLDKSVNFKWLIIFGNGLSGAMFSILSAVVWPRFFGIKHLGAISGFALSCMVIGSAVGPFFMSKLFEISGNYKSGSIIMIIIASVLGLMSIKANNENENMFLKK